MGSSPVSTLGIIAAGGGLPVQVAAAAVAAGRPVFVLGLEGMVDADLTAFAHALVKPGQVGKMQRIAKDQNIKDVVLIGSIDKRPDLAGLGLDLGAIGLVPRIAKALAAGGDDMVLRSLIELFEDQGVRVVGAHEVAPALTASPGHVAGPAVTGELERDGRLAMEAALAIGRLDIGQGAVAVGGRVVALEAAEGTDAMLARVEHLREIGRIRWRDRAGVLAKRAKPQQDLRVDLPTIGPMTVDAVAAAGLRGIVIEAGRVLLADRETLVERAAATATSVMAVEFQPGAPGAGEA